MTYDPYVIGERKRAPAAKTQKPYAKPEYLVKIYRWIENYIKKNKFPPSTREMVHAGFAKSTSVIRYYFDRMEEYKMLERVQVADEDGRMIAIARGIRLLPLSKAHSLILETLEKEKTK